MSSRSTSNWYPSAMTFIGGGVREAANTERAPLSHQRQPLKVLKVFLFPSGREREAAIVSTVTLTWSSSCLLQWGRNFSLLYLPVCLDTASRLKQEERRLALQTAVWQFLSYTELERFCIFSSGWSVWPEGPMWSAAAEPAGWPEVETSDEVSYSAPGLALTYGTGAVKPLLLHENFGSYSKMKEKSNMSLRIILAVHMNPVFLLVSTWF